MNIYISITLQVLGCNNSNIDISTFIVRILASCKIFQNNTVQSMFACHPPRDWLVLSSCCKACPEHTAVELPVSPRCFATLAVKTKPWFEPWNWLIYKLLKYFFVFYLSFLKTLKATAVGALAQQLRPSQGHSGKKNLTDKRTDRRTVRQGICHRWQSHSSFHSHPSSNRKRVGCRKKCGDRWLVWSKQKQAGSSMVSSHSPDMIYSRAAFPILGLC